jgi:hypothetical protein
LGLFFDLLGDKATLLFLTAILIIKIVFFESPPLAGFQKKRFGCFQCRRHWKHPNRFHNENCGVFNNKKSNRTKADRLTKTFLLAEMDWQIGIWAKYLFPQVTVVLKAHFAI